MKRLGVATTMMNKVLLACMMLLLSGATSRAASFDVMVNTTPIKGRQGFVAFNFVGGSSVQGNTAMIQSFATDSALGAATTAGSVLGNLVPGPLSFSDAQFLDEWNQAVRFGTRMSFKLSVTANNTPGEIPDSFSFYLLDSNKIPFATTDPTGADSLFALDINGINPPMLIYTSGFASVTVATPRPTRTATPKRTATPTRKATPRQTPTPTRKPTPRRTATHTKTATPRRTPTPTGTATRTRGRTPTGTATQRRIPAPAMPKNPS